MKKPIITLLLVTLTVCALIPIYNLPAGTAESPTLVRGILTTDTVWQKSGSPYNLTGALSIYTGVTLTVEPGVIVNLNDNYIQVNGTLTARGTASEPIQFLGGRIFFTNNSRAWDENTQTGSIIENSFVNGSSNGGYDSALISITKAAPSIKNSEIRGNYYGVGAIRAQDSTFSLSNCNVQADYTAIRVEGGNATIDNNVISTYDDTAIYIYQCQNASVSGNMVIGKGGAYGLAITSSNSSIYNNTIFGFETGINSNAYFTDPEWPWYNIRTQGNMTIANNLLINNKKGIECTVDGSGSNRSYITIQNNTSTRNQIGLLLTFNVNVNKSNVIIQYNNFYGNKDYDLKITTAYNATAKNNWWGTSDSNTVANRIYDYSFNFNLGNVTYEPMLSSINLAAPIVPTFTITTTAGFGGTIVPNNATAVFTYGDKLYLDFDPNSGFIVSNLTVNGISCIKDRYYSSPSYCYSYYDGGGYCYFTDIDKSYNVEVSFTSLHYTTTIHVTHVGQGTVSPSDGDNTVELGTTITLTATPNTAQHYAFMCWLEGGIFLSNSNPYTYTVDGSAVITAVFYDPVAKESPTSTPSSSSSSSSSSGSSSGSSSSTSSSPTPTSAAPEFTTLVMLPVFIAGLFAVLSVKLKSHKAPLGLGR